MKQLALYDFLRHLKRNLFMGFLLAVICLLITSLYSLFSYEYGKYKPFDVLETNDGFFVGDKTCGGMHTFGFEQQMADREEIEKLYQVYMGSLNTESSYYTAYIYEEWLWSNWQGRLKSGSWFDEDDVNSDTMQVIICGSISSYNVGDIFYCETKNGRQKCVVKGILQDGTEIPFSNSYSAADTTYTSLYSVPDKENKYVILQKEAAERNGISFNSAGLWAFVKYKAQTSEEQKETTNKAIARMTLSTSYPHDIFRELSFDKLIGKLFVYIPIIAAGILLAFVSLFTVAFINVEKGSRYYSIYYLVGGNKKECFKIACGNVLGTVAVSAIFYMLGEILLKTYTRHENIVYSTMPGAGMLAVGLYIVFALFLVICMYWALRKNSPLELLRKHN